MSEPNNDEVLPDSVGEEEAPHASLPGKHIKVRWSEVNNDLGKYHNDFIEEFPNCLFVRVIQCGTLSTLKDVGAGGLALIREDVMIANAERKIDAEGKVSIDRDTAFFILEKDIIAFGKFGNR